MVPALIGVVAAALSGCRNPDIRTPIRRLVYWDHTASKGPTDELRDEHYKSWPIYIQQAVDERRILKGMDKLQVQAATRLNEKQIDKNVQKTDAGIVEIWHVWLTYNGWGFARMTGGFKVAIVFENGKVIDYHREK